MNRIFLATGAFAAVVCGLFVFPLNFSAVTRSEHTPGNVTDDVLCGPKSLHIALSLLGDPISFMEIAESCALQESGVAFGDLRDVVNRRGYEADIKRIRWEELSASECVGVLFLDGAHFVAVDARECKQNGNRVKIYDPGNIGRWTDQEQLNQHWDGESLLLGRRSSVDVPYFETCWIDAGLLTADSHSYRIPVSNRGKSPIKVVIADTSCGCTTASINEELLAPGATAYVDATIALKKKRGLFQESVEVSCSNFSKPVAIWLSGAKYPNALCRSHAYVGDVMAGSTIEKVIYVHDPGDGSLLLDSACCRVRLDCESTNDSIPCNINVTKVDARGDNDAGGLYTVKEGDYRITVSATIPSDLEPQSLIGCIDISTNLSDRLKTCTVELAGRIIANLECEPPAILLDAVGPEPFRMVVRNRKGQPHEFKGYQFDGQANLGVEVSDISVQRTESNAVNHMLAEDELALRLHFRRSKSNDDIASARKKEMSTLRIITTGGFVDVPLLVRGG